MCGLYSYMRLSTVFPTSLLPAHHTATALTLVSQVIDAALRHVATRLLSDAFDMLAAASGGGGGRLKTEGPVFNNNTVALVRSVMGPASIVLVESCRNLYLTA